MIFRQAIEDDGGDGKILLAEAIDVGMEREEPVLPVNGPEDPLPLGHFQDADSRLVLYRLKRKLLVTRNDDGTGNRRKVAGLTALLVVLDQLVDFAPDDLTLVRFLARGDPPLEEVPVHFRGGSAPLTPADRRLGLLAVAEHLEPDELVDIAGGEGGLVELHAELLHPYGGNVDHRKRKCKRLSGDLYNRFAVS